MNQKSVLLFLISIFILTSCITAQGTQNKKITVTVIDKKTNSPVRNINVDLRTIINFVDITHEKKLTSSTGSCSFSFEMKDQNLYSVCAEPAKGFYPYYDQHETVCKEINKDSPNSITLYLTSDSMQRIEYFEKITPHYQIDELISLLKSDKYKPESKSMLPALVWSDIPKLLEIANDSARISNFPVNPISSYSRKDCYLGIISLWFIESIRIAQLKHIIQPYQRFPSQNPILIDKLKQTTNPEQWRTPNTTIMMATAFRAYQKWWEKVKKLDPKEACKINPLEGTGLSW